MNTLVENIHTQLDTAMREEYSERAAIMEFEGKLERNYAEALALLDVLHRHPYALTGLTAMHIKLSGYSQWWLTTDPFIARQYLASINGNEVGIVSLSDVVSKQFTGMAMLKAIV